MANILLAEDDESMRFYLHRALEAVGHMVISAENGAVAEEMLICNRFDLVLSDVVMPEKDGIELARSARQRQPDIKVMFITGFSGIILEDQEGGFAPSMVLSKPFHLKDLVEQVERVLLE
ncbi:response regulator [Kiloniella laminariae]|uniref:Response regulator n=1 Tax=Kiloniella laminariae TaxID=454162 RepID=A0ABT4LIE4_9PROT|nr:response regulator [Kiloniella laminariae]MCZ4280882.1 response regulator [Kiloniella laminariae]